MVTHDGALIEARGALKLVSFPPVDPADASTQGSAPFQGILTGVVTGGIIWFGILALFVF